MFLKIRWQVYAVIAGMSTLVVFISLLPKDQSDQSGSYGLPASNVQDENLSTIQQSREISDPVNPSLFRPAAVAAEEEGVAGPSPDHRVPLREQEIDLIQDDISILRSNELSEHWSQWRKPGERESAYLGVPPMPGTRVYGN